MYAQGASIGRCAITGNTCPGDGGGGVYSAGAIFDRCTISGNTAYAGGGVAAINTTFTNTIVWGNCASFQANEVDGVGTDSFICCCINAAGVNGAVNYVGSQVFTNPIFCAPASCTLAPTTQGTYTLGNTSRVFRGTARVAP